jgi:hypothetical protein
MRKSLTTCNNSYKQQIFAREMEYEKEKSDLSFTKGRALFESEKVGIYLDIVKAHKKEPNEYQACIDSSKSLITEGAKEYISYFKNSQKQGAKDVLTQWFTSIDTINSKSFEVELVKFDNAVNVVKVEAMTN